MSKQFFRFLRGEINGFYLNNINNACNRLSESVKSFLADFNQMQFKTEEEVKEGEVPVPSNVLDGLSVFTGAFSPYVWQESLIGSVRFTQSHKVNGVEYSERGLFSPEDEAFTFIRTDNTEYPDDINTQATPNRRSTFVEPDRQPLGYFPEGEVVIRENGTIDESKLLSAPRPNHADAPYYGKDFLYFAEEAPVLAITSNRVLVQVIKAMQWVRYNGMSVASLAKFAEILCPNFLFITKIDWDSHYAFAVVSYGIDEDYEAEDKLMKEQCFALLAGRKLSQFSFDRVNIQVTRDEEGNVISVTEV